MGYSKNRDKRRKMAGAYKTGKIQKCVSKVWMPCGMKRYKRVEDTFNTIF